MESKFVVWKPVGKTPLQVLEEFRVHNGIGADVPLTYAGRLDPMAEGKLIILVGEECKKKEEYTKLPKEYEFEILFGVKSDTGDILGLVEAGDSSVKPTIDEVKSSCEHFLGEQVFAYPAFSSKPVEGKPLHAWALEGRLGEISIPTYHANIHSIAVQEHRIFLAQEMVAEAVRKISLFIPDADKHVGSGGDFRKPQILERWNRFLKTNEGATFLVVSCTAVVSSGTYIRTLAEKIAERCGTVGLAYSITRTRVIGFSLDHE